MKKILNRRIYECSEGQKRRVGLSRLSIDNKKILASHSLTFKEENQAVKKKAKNDTKQVMKKIEETKQQSTLGDLDSLAALKEDLDSNK